MHTQFQSMINSMYSLLSKPLLRQQKQPRNPTPCKCQVLYRPAGQCTHALTRGSKQKPTPTSLPPFSPSEVIFEVKAWKIETKNKIKRKPKRLCAVSAGVSGTVSVSNVYIYFHSKCARLNRGHPFFTLHRSYIGFTAFPTPSQLCAAVRLSSLYITLRCQSHCLQQNLG